MRNAECGIRAKLLTLRAPNSALRIFVRLSSFCRRFGVIGLMEESTRNAEAAEPGVAPIRVLAVDNDGGLARGVVERLAKVGYDGVVATRGGEVARRRESETLDIV